MTKNKAKNLYVGAVLLCLFALSLAGFLHVSKSFQDQEVLKFALLGLSFGLIPLIINLTKSGILLDLVKDFSCKVKNNAPKILSGIPKHQV